jgi:hypothetical protein
LYAVELNRYVYLCRSPNILQQMALIKSISGIRGTIGGKTNDNLTPLDVVKFTAAYGTGKLCWAATDALVGRW